MEKLEQIKEKLSETMMEIKAKKEELTKKRDDLKEENNSFKETTQKNQKKLKQARIEHDYYFAKKLDIKNHIDL